MDSKEHVNGSRSKSHDDPTHHDKIELKAVESKETDNEVEGEWEDYIPEPPDGGWGWVIMIASFFNNFILDGIAYCFGVFLQQYVTYFNTTVSSASLANSLLCGVYLVVGPIVGALVNKFGMRPVGIAGSLIGAFAFIISIFSPTIAVLQITYGVIGGFGFGMMFLPSVVGVGYYFEKKRAIATGIAVCGTGIGTFCLAPLGKYLLKHFDWRSTHIILAGIILQGCITSSLMRPLTARRRKQKNANSSHGASNQNKLPLDEEKLLAEKTPANAAQAHLRRRTTSRQPSISNTVGSRLLIAESASPADILHQSAFLPPPESAGSRIDMQNLSRPMYRKDIFYSGSVMNLDHGIKSTVSLKSYVQSITSIPQTQPDRLACLNYLPKPIADILAEMLDITILRNKGMLLFCLASVIAMLGFYVPIVYTASRAQNMGIDDDKAALLLSIMGICNTVGRILSGCLSFTPNISPLIVNNICMIFSAVACAVIPFCTTFVTMAAAIAAYGLFASTMISLASILMCEIVGLEKLTNGFGLLCLVRGITAIAGPPVAGMLYDATGSYDATFFAGGGCILASGLLHFMLLLPYFKRREE